MLSQFSQFHYRDYVLLARTCGRWQLVTKVFQRIEGPPRDSSATATDERRAEILELVARTFRATDTYDADLLAQSYHARATRLEIEEDQLVTLGLPEWQARWREKWVAGEVNTASRSIAKLDSCGTAAVVQLVHDNGRFASTEYALALKVESAWKIMALTATP